MKKREKPHFSVWSNCCWIFRMQFKYAVWSFWVVALAVPLSIGISCWNVYVPALVVKAATAGRGVREIALTLGGLSLAVLFLMIAKDVLVRFEGGEKDLFRRRIAMLIRKKSLTCFYELYEKKETRDLGNRAMRATEMWGGVQPICDISVTAFSLLENGLSYLLFGGLLAGVNPWLLPVIMVGPVVNLFVTRCYNRWKQKYYEKYMEIEKKIHYVADKTAQFSAVKDIRIYSMSDWFRKTFRSLTAELDERDAAESIRRFGVSLVSLVLILLRDGLAYALLIKMAVDGALTVDRFVLYFAAISSFASFFGNILDCLGKLHELSLRICDIRRYLELPERAGSEKCGSVEKKEPIEPHLMHAPEITFEHVSFRYEGAEEDTIRDISFTIHSGEAVALVGLNGAGKTTLVKLLCGLYRPTKGRIYLNGVPADSFTWQDYYRLFAPVFQDSKAAFFSVAETLTGKIGEAAEEQRVRNCIRMAGLERRVDSMPEGIHTKLDKQLYENAVELSGGEMQKLMLARALYKDAPMLVLDEPTAALDPIAESEIYQEYRNMTQGKSALFISHRLASTRFCHRIIYLKDGAVCEAGTHEELMAREGEYSALYELQSCWYRENYGKGDEGNEVV